MASAYTREQRELSTGRSILVVTEGEKTERNYFEALRDRLRISTFDLSIVHPPATDPVSLCRHAIELRDRKAAAAKRGSGVAYDEVWVVFDLEKIHDERRRLAAEAINLGRPQNILFAQSNPCFEFWLLLHEEYTTAPFKDCGEAGTRLKKHWPKYTKGAKPASEFIEKVAAAVRHAGQCRSHHAKGGGDGNPSTDVDLLARALNSATRPHLQFRF